MIAELGISVSLWLWVEIIIFRKGGCADSPERTDKPQTFNITSKDEFMRIFSGGHGEGDPGQFK